MPKSKRGPSLFEVYRKGRADEPINRLDGLENLPRRTPARESASAFKATLASLAKSIGGGRSDGDHDAGDAAPSSVGVEGGRIHFALSSRGAGVALFALVLLVGMFFWLGKWYGRQGGLADGRAAAQQSIEADAREEIAKARQSRPVEGLFDGIGESPVAKRTEQPQQPAVERARPRPVTALTAVTAAPSTDALSAAAWVKGNTYVVVQNFRGDAQQDAARAQEYLRAHGVQAVIVGSSSRGFRLIATTGFNFKDDTQRRLADRFLKKIRTIGAGYFQSGGRYKLEGFFATLTSESW